MPGFAPSLRLGPGLRDLAGDEVTEQALTVLREALSNVGRHAAASRADVNVDVDDDGNLAVLSDRQRRRHPSGVSCSGLRNLAEGDAKLGGGLLLKPAEAGARTPGTRLEWRVPAAGPGSAAES